MNDQNIEKLLTELAQATAELVRPGLAEDIKNRIHAGPPHKGGMDTVSIIIDLRVGRLTAAAAIIVTTIALAGLMSSTDPAGSIYQDGKVLLGYCLFGPSKNEVQLVKSKYEQMLESGKDVAYYGDNIDSPDGNSLLMHWRLSDGSYKVIFGDLREETVSAEKLIRLQSGILQKRTK